MGRLKQLLPLGDTTVIERCIDTIIEAETGDIVVVVGPGQKELIEAIKGYPVTIAVNEDVGSDMAESVRTGLSATKASSTGVMVCLSDHPLVMTDTLKLLARTHSKKSRSIVIPVYCGRRGHPVLFPGGVIREIFHLGNLREIIQRDPKRVELVEVGDEGVMIDMDTMEDYIGIVRKIGMVEADKQVPKAD